jgi:magnesium chelatase family protein
VAAARRLQADRYAGTTASSHRGLNVDATGPELEAVATPDAAGQLLITDAATKFSLSARSYHRVLKVARTIADLEACPQVKRIHIAEALSYRRRPVEEANTARSGALAQ